MDDALGNKYTVVEEEEEEEGEEEGVVADDWVIPKRSIAY
jgi:hypothetical protein